MSRDPIGEAGGLNAYNAFSSNPITIIDRLGLDNWSNPGAGQNAPPDIVITDPGFRNDPPDSGWGDAFDDLYLWICGGNCLGSVEFGQDEARTQRIRQSRIADKLRQFYLDKFKDAPCDKWGSVDNFGASFGVMDFFADLDNGTAHFVGSADGEAQTVSYNSKKCEVTARFTLYNTTSLKSGLYHLPPDSWNLPPGFPMGNWKNTYTWEEKFPCKCCSYPLLSIQSGFSNR